MEERVVVRWLFLRAEMGEQCTFGKQTVGDELAGSKLSMRRNLFVISFNLFHSDQSAVQKEPRRRWQTVCSESILGIVRVHLGRRFSDRVEDRLSQSLMPRAAWPRITAGLKKHGWCRLRAVFARCAALIRP